MSFDNNAAAQSAAPHTDLAWFLWRETQGKKTNVAYILLIFFGTLGVHRFYLGQVGFGILWLLTLGLFGVGAFVDIFILGGLVEKTNQKRWQEIRPSVP